MALVPSPNPLSFGGMAAWCSSSDHPSRRLSSEALTVPIGLVSKSNMLAGLLFMSPDDPDRGGLNLFEAGGVASFNGDLFSGKMGLPVSSRPTMPLPFERPVFSSPLDAVSLY